MHARARLAIAALLLAAGCSGGAPAESEYTWSEALEEHQGDDTAAAARAPDEQEAEPVRR